jgi:hypothetical protein
MPLRVAARTLLPGLLFLIVSSPTWLQVRFGLDRGAYGLATVALVIAAAAVALLWRETIAATETPSSSLLAVAFGIVAAAAAAAIVIVACRMWLVQTFAIPNDPLRADMLVVVEQGVRRVLQGRSPYVMYHLPWDAPLPYGPVLWAPFIAPVLLHADVRFVTVVGELFVPLAGALTVAALAARRHIVHAWCWVALVAAIALNPDLARFASIGHTPAYWPLLALFAWLVVRERWTGAAIAMGLLVVARTTMVAVVPVLLMTVWLRDRARFTRVVVLVALCAVLPFAPFAIRDPHALVYALYGSYEHTMKDFVWTQTTWVQHTIGVTGELIARGWPRAVEPVQILVMIGTYALAWLRLRAGAAPAQWMGLALLAFSMTTLWPVTYVYFDPLLLLVCAAIAGTPWLAPGAPIGTRWLLALGSAVVLVIAMAAVMLPANPIVDAGSGDGRACLYAGFSGDEREGARTFAWIDGQRATVMLPRRTRRDATIELEVEPFLPTPASAQVLTPVLNGVPLGAIHVPGGWSRLTVHAPAAAWTIGANRLDLFCAIATSPKSAGVSADTRTLAMAVDEIRVK